MGRYLIDSNIVSDYLAENLDNSLLDFLDPIFESQPCLSVVTQIELLSWKTDPSVENLIKQFLDNTQIFNLMKKLFIDVCNSGDPIPLKFQML